MMKNLDKKIIWSYWHQGFDCAPWVVQSCIRQLQDLHPSWELHLLHAGNVFEFAEPLPIRSTILEKMTLAHRSDLLRTQLLMKNGGVWIDPTVFCTQTLDSWLDNYLASGLFVFCNPGRDRLISNWFIAAKENNALLKILYSELCRYWDQHEFKNLGRDRASTLEYWLNRIVNRNLEWPCIWFTPLMTRWLKLYPYMVYHYKFYDLVKNHEECAQIWEQSSFFSADFPHKLQRFGLLKPLDDEAKSWIDLKKSPLFKLTWKMDATSPPKKTVIDYLFNGSA